MASWTHLLFAATVVAQAQAPAPQPDPAVAQRLRQDVTFLAAPELKGRGNGYPELDTAARRIEGELKGLGLVTQVQRFPFVARVARERQGATLVQGADTRTLVWGRDLEALGLSGDAGFQNGKLLFLGYGIQVAGGYDDLAGLDLQGKVAVIARTVPDLDGFARLPRGERGLLARLKRLEAAKVAGVLVLEEGGLRPLLREEGPVQLDIPVVGVTAAALNGACGDLAASFKAIKDTGRPASRPADATLSLDLKLRREEAQLPNVIAVIPGRDPKLRDEFIVLGAHMDHLGLGERHSMGGAQARGLVHPGADDNGSGTAMVLELARELKQAGPRRSILLLHFGGEEEGLLGSSYWLQHPTQALGSVKFMLNFDMVGRFDPRAPKLLLGGLGAPKSATEAAQKLAPASFSIQPDVGAGVGGSDHMSFALAKIPTFFFFTGAHEQYHRPTDTADLINYAGMALLTDYARTVALSLANGDTVPAFDPETAKIQGRGGYNGARVAFGVVPDFAENAAGFRISGVSHGSTAEGIGLQPGDIITKVGNRPVKNIQDYMAALEVFAPGDKAVIQWMRQAQPMQAEATLKARN